ncbi:hypothetical protein [Sedimentitalea sp.]|uniref:hypothetical protein n=1 Tax=Sedimentitalea sp. TaxID=2048915 RepID=UPI00329A7CF2
MRAILSGMAAMLSFSVSSAIAQDANQALVRNSELRCVLDHAESYLENAQPLIVIFLSLCPNANPRPADLALLAHNSGAPTPPTLQEEAKTSTILTLTREKMACLSRLYSDGDLDVVLADEIVDVDAHC